MTAFVIANVEVTDPEIYKTYIPLASASVAAFGGRYIARGGAVEVQEGKTGWHRVVILEFKDLETARAWYNSPSYAEARAIRQKASRGDLLFVAGAA